MEEHSKDDKDNTDHKKGSTVFDGFIKVNQNALGDLNNLIKDGKVKFSDVRVLLYFIEHVGFNNKLNKVSKHMAEYLDIRIDAVSRCLNNLSKLGLIVLSETHGSTKLYDLDKDIFWKGSDEAYKYGPSSKVSCNTSKKG